MGAAMSSSAQASLANANLAEARKGVKRREARGPPGGAQGSARLKAVTSISTFISASTSWQTRVVLAGRFRRHLDPGQA